MKNRLRAICLATMLSVVSFGSLADQLYGPVTARAESVFFFAEESANAPVKKTNWDLVNGETLTMNLWVTTDFQKLELHDFTAYCGLTYGGTVSAETLVIHQDVEKNGYWDNALAGEWTADNRGIDDLGWYGETSTSGTELVPGTYLLGTVELSVADGTTLNDVAMFSMAKSWTYVWVNNVTSFPEFETTTVTIRNAPATPNESVPEPSTWMTFCGLAIIGSVWYRRHNRQKTTP